MTDPNETPDARPDAAAPSSAEPEGGERRPGERLAKAIARAGLGSRRDAEVWIGEGRVRVNGAVVETAAFNVLPSDHVEVDGRPLPARERTRLWLYHKPRGYVTTNRDPEGRETVFEVLPAGLPRVMTIGRLDINTEGLLLLTNDGGLARVLELPETGWLRRYRVRAFGRVTQEQLDALKDGVTIDGFAYGAIEATVERQQSDNVWLMIGLREGKNREVKRVAEHLGLAVNRLIRVSFGPFQLGSLAEGEAEEVRTRTLSDQLGPRLAEEAGCDFEAGIARVDEAPRMTGTGGRGGGARKTDEPRDDRGRLADPSQRVGRRAPLVRPRDMAAPATPVAAPEDAAKRLKRGAPVADRRGRKVAVERVARVAGDEAPKRVRREDKGAAERFGAPSRSERPAFGPGSKPERPARSPRDGDARPARAPSGDRPRTGRPQRTDTKDAPRFARGGDRPERGERSEAPRGDRPARSFGDRPSRAPAGERPARAFGDRPARGPRTERPDRPRTDRPERPRSDRPREGAERPREQSAAPAPRWRDDATTPERPARREWKDRPTGAPRPGGARPPRRDGDERPARAERPRTDRPQGDRPRSDRSQGDRPQGERPARGDRPFGKPAGARPPRREGGDRPTGDWAKPGERPTGAAGRVAGKPRPAGGGFKPRGPGGPGGKSGGPGGRGPAGKGPAGKGRPSGGGKGRPGGADRRR